ncbi:MAG TPA: MATE family efflux transporter [Methylothermaceae bacterium]|nr:MATE family efflux transporter [Methylothermaceae bacterium]
MMLSNLSTPLLGMVDTAVVGHLAHPYYLGAVALGGTIFSFLFWSFGFLRMGTTGLTAQAHGKNDPVQINATLARALLIAFALAGMLLLLRRPLLTLSLRLLEASSQVEFHTQTYFDIRIFSAPATLGNYACIGWFIGLRNTRIPLLLVLLVNLCNIAFDFWFVWVWRWQVAGVAMASVLAEYLGLAVGLTWVHKYWRRFSRPCRRHIFHWPQLRRMFAINANLMVRTLLLLFSFAFFTAQSARLGDVTLAANTILLNLQSFMAYTLDGFAHAAEAMVGNALGKGNIALLRRNIRLAGTWSLIFATLFTLCYALAGKWIISLLTGLEPVRTTAVEFLPFAIVLPLISAWSFVLDGVFIGLTRAREMRDVMIGSVVFCYLPLWWWLQDLDNLGLWLAFSGFMALRTLGMEIQRRRILSRLNPRGS